MDSGRDLYVDERRGPERDSVEQHLRADLGLRRQRHDAGQLRQRQRDRLVRERPDVDFGVERVVARQLRGDAMRAGTQQEPVADLHLEQRARQADAGRRRLDVERHGFRREREPRDDGEHGEPPTRSRSSCGSGRARSATLLAAPGLNAIGVIATSDVRPAIARELVEIRRRRVAGRDDPVDAQRERAVAGDSALEPRSVERDDVAVLELARARQRLAADAQVARAAAGLNEECVLEAADLDAARDALERDVGIVSRRRA